MKVIYSLKSIPRYINPVVAIGVFDGLHRAHRRILKDTSCKSLRIKGTSMVFTFYPHPQGQASIYSLKHRLRLIEELGIDVCVVVRFNKAFQDISAKAFVEKIIVDKLHARFIFVGRNFRFGRNAEGDISLLKKLAALYQFRIKVYDVIKNRRKGISSTYLRKLITKGKIGEAEKLLLRPVSILGKVTKGTSLATQLGFPTANINPEHEILPPAGIYRVKIVMGRNLYQGICYIGTRPTFNAASESLDARNKEHIEVHIFDFHKNIYGSYLEIQFIGKIREQKRFADTKKLQQQVFKDIRFAKQMFSRH